MFWSATLDNARNDGLLNHGRVKYMNNHYNSPELTVKIHKCKTHVFGTLRMNWKGLLKDLKDMKLTKGEVIFCTWPPMTVLI